MRRALRCLLAYATVLVTVIGGAYALVTVHATPNHGFFLTGADHSSPLYVFAADIILVCGCAAAAIGLIALVIWSFAQVFGDGDC